MFVPFPSGKLCKLFISMNLFILYLFHAALCSVYQGSPAWWTQTRQPLCLLKASLCPRSRCPCTKPLFFQRHIGFVGFVGSWMGLVGIVLAQNNFSLAPPSLSSLRMSHAFPTKSTWKTSASAYTNMSDHKYAITTVIWHTMTQYDNSEDVNSAESLICDYDLK